MLVYKSIMSRQKPTKEDLLRAKQASFDEAALATAPPERRQSPRAKLSTDVFHRARSTLNTLGDAWKSRPSATPPDSPAKRTKRQMTLDYFLKPRKGGDAKARSGGDNHVVVVDKLVISPRNFLVNSERQPVNGSALKKFRSQMSVDAELPVENGGLTRLRPATVAGGGGLELPRELSGAMTDRPRKKLSFREPEILGYSFQKNETLPRSRHGGGHAAVHRPELFRSVSEVLRSADSYEDMDLENQAMRVVRTVGQAFEVCHKLSIEEAPSPEPQELISSLQDELDLEESNLELTANSDHASDRASDQISVHKRDLLSEPVHNESSSMAASELMNGGGEGVQQRPSRLEMLPPPPLAPGSKKTPLTTAEMYSSPLVEPLKPTGGGSLPQPGSPLSPHHEVQLLREQLDQQTQQTQAAVAQMQLLQDQLSAERAARLEAQARTHQLLVHNRELLDHITALVAHLQDNERGSGAMQTAQNSASQVPTHLTCMTQQRCDPGSPYLSDSSYLLSGPESPIRKTNSGNMFAFNSYPQEHHLAAPHIIKQYLDAYSNPPYSGYNHYAAYAPTAAPPPPPPPQSYLYQNNNHNHSTNNNNILQPPPALTKKKLSPSPRPLRQSYETFTNIYGGDNGGDVYGAGGGGAYANDFCEKNKNLIKPLSQVSTLTTTDEEGRVRVIVPVSDEDDDKVVESLVTLKITDEDGNKRVINGGPPCITRSTSEKLPNRSELMSQVQRTMWARHTTK